MRQWLYDVLRGDAELAGLVGTRIHQANTLDRTPATPFLIFKLSTETPRAVPARNTLSQVWAHDTPGSYVRVDQILDRVKAVLEGQGNSGDFFKAEWLDDSEDLFDDGNNTVTRFSRYQLVNRG